MLELAYGKLCGYLIGDENLHCFLKGLKMSMDSVYYRIFLDNDNKINVVMMQYFDETDYDQGRFYRNDNQIPYKFMDEEEAIEFVNKTFRPEYIHEDYLRVEPRDLFKNMLLS